MNTDSGSAATTVDGTFVSSAVFPPGGAKTFPPVQKPTALELDRYNFQHACRGRCVIVNNHHFDRLLTRQSDRDGTEVDAAAVESVFVSLGFEVMRYDDLTINDMSINLREVSREDHSDADCFVCVILSHGEDGIIYATNGTLKLHSLVEMFKGDRCPSLAGKPKLFFVQACRGRRYDAGTEVAEDSVDAAGDATGQTSVRRVPVESDILLAYSVVPGYFSWRNNYDGSWFVQALVRVLREHGAAMELGHMMTLVNRVVAYDFESCTDDDFTSGMKQVPCVVSTLTKLLYFEPKD